MVNDVSLHSNYRIIFQADGLLVVADDAEESKEFVKMVALPWNAEYISLPQAPIVPTAVTASHPINKLRKTLKMEKSVNELVAAVNEADLLNFALFLTGEGGGSTFVSRQSQSRDAVRSGEWATSVFESYGFNVTSDTFSSTYCPNIIAEKTGTRDPNTLVIIGAHLDDRNVLLNDATGRAPGANDDGRFVSFLLLLLLLLLIKKNKTNKQKNNSLFQWLVCRSADCQGHF